MAFQCTIAIVLLSLLQIAAIGEHGPYNDAALYMAAVMKKLKSAGIDLAALMRAERRI
ncbi:MAG: hypothetical protein K6E30_10230 [Lachnospiraceae bacterium]|nr:hypothetical protein [Lachnospiraceae bacterium]